MSTWESMMSALQSRLDAAHPFGTKTITLRSETYSWDMQVLVADTPETRARGMVNRSFGDGEDGLLFVHSQEVDVEFHMQGVPDALVVVWYDSSGTYIAHQLMPRATRWRYSSPRPFMYALELPVPFAEAHDLTKFTLALP